MSSLEEEFTRKTAAAQTNAQASLILNAMNKANRDRKKHVQPLDLDKYRGMRFTSDVITLILTDIEDKVNELVTENNRGSHP